MSRQNLENSGLFFPGSRVGIMLAHGLGGTPVEMRNVARRLNRYGFTVFCPLLAGHCGSEAELVATQWNDWTGSLEIAHEQLTKYTDVVFAGGLSAGAVLSLYLAQQKPASIRGLALYSTTLKWDGWSIPKLSFLLPLVLRLPYFGKRYRFEEVFPYGLKNERLRNKIHAHMQSGDSKAAGLSATPGTSLRELWRLVDLVKERLPDTNIPTLLVHAQNDDIASVRNARYVQDHLGGPSEIVLLEDSYHMITVDQERDKVADVTAAFFTSLLTKEEKHDLTCYAASFPSPGSAGDTAEDGTLS